MSALVLRLLPFALAALLGSGLNTAIQHLAPWGSQARLERMTKDRDQWKAAQHETRNLAIGWARREGQCQKARRDLGRHSDRTAIEAAATSAADISNAFSRGIRVGRSMCGAKR